jgi:hypothetical protein
MDRRDFYKRQPVTQAELDAAFDKVEAGIWSFPADTALFGIMSGMTPSGAGGALVAVTSGVCYDSTGKRIKLYYDNAPSKNHSYATATDGTPTAVSSGQERWIAICARGGIKMSDLRVDGDGNNVYHIRDEAPVGDGAATPGGVDTLYIVAGASAPTGTAVKPAIPLPAVIICDMKRTPSDASNVLDTGRRQINPLHHIAVDTPADTGNIALLMKDLVTWLGGRTNVAQSTLKAQLDKLINDLGATTASDDGAERIGAAAGTNLAAGSVRSQLDELDTEKAGLALANTFSAANIFQALLTAQAKMVNTLQSTVTTPAMEVTGAGPAGDFALIAEWPCGNCKFRVYRFAMGGPLAASDTEPVLGGGNAGIMFTSNAQWNGSAWTSETASSNSTFLLFPLNMTAGGGGGNTSGIVLGYRDSGHDSGTWDNTYGVVTGWTKLHRIGWYNSSSGNMGGARAGTGVLRLDTGIWRGMSGTGDVSGMTAANRKTYYPGGRGYNSAAARIGGRITLQPSYIATPTQGTLTSESTANAGTVTIDVLDTLRLTWSFSVTALGDASSYSTVEII